MDPKGLKERVAAGRVRGSQPRYIRFRKPPLTGDAFVDEGFAVGEECGDLLVENTFGLRCIIRSFIQ